MAKNPNQQQKLLRLQQIFLQETDEAHPLTMSELIARLESMGISAERKSLYENIETLNLCGMDILSERRGAQTVYYSAGGNFEAAELRLLADAVASSRFITAKKSDQLLKKLGELTNRHQSAELRRQVHVAGRVKSMNETIFYLVDDLHHAIDRNRSVTFHYYDWVLEGGTLKRKPRHGGKSYCVSPWQLLWQDEFYYLIAFDHEAAAIRHYRVDRMGDISLNEQPRLGAEQFAEIRMDDYTARLFGMFGGKPERVVLSCPERLLGVMIDRFGKDIRPTMRPDGRIEIHTDVIPSLPFYGWLLSLGEEAQLEAPEHLRQEFETTLKRRINHG
ncbi:MAG: WYL domain-containing protein [Clostridia bacterium]|nr:WYL domain-containing protein [Clostridia bacterium]